MEAEVKLKNIDKYLDDLKKLKEEIIDILDCIDELEEGFTNVRDKLNIVIDSQYSTPSELVHYLKEQLVQYLKEKKIS